MQSPTLTTQKLRVASIRSDNPKGFGGAIFYAKALNEQGHAINGEPDYVVKAPSFLLDGVTVQKGQWWQVHGELETYQRQINGYLINEPQIMPHDMLLLKPSGELIVRFIADNPAFKGIGDVKVQQLWEHYGEDLYTYLDKGDVKALSQVVTQPMALTLAEQWQIYGDSVALRFLTHHRFTTKLSKKLLAFYGKKTMAMISADPYCILAFSGQWRYVDKLALNHFGLAKDDPRRIHGAMEEALYRTFDDGNTAVTLIKLQERLTPLLGNQLKGQTEELLSQAMVQGARNGNFTCRLYTDELLFHAVGPFLMEKSIAQAVLTRLNHQPGQLEESIISTELDAFEQHQGFCFNQEQRQAVITAVNHRFAIITGSAGTGKTALLKALYHIYDHIGINIHQMALAGKAVKRMMEATQRDATTIAGFLHHVDKSAFGQQSVIVIDEASMLDVITFYRLLRSIPDETHIILTGDENQLPSIGPGLVLRDLLSINTIPSITLTQINRYGNEIATVANAIKDGIWPAIPQDINHPVCFIPCDKRDINNQLISLYQSGLEKGINMQIIEPLKNGQFFGTKKTNDACQSRFVKNKEPVKLYNEAYEQWEKRSIHEGEPVICTQNHWDKNLQNGSIGTVLKVYQEPKECHNDEGEMAGYAYADIQWDDGQVLPLTDDLIDDLSLCYSVTTHKAQGSQWHTVIFPVYEARNLDVSLLYTAITRAQAQIILVGDVEVAKKVVAEPPHAHQRITGLKYLFNEMLEGK